MPCQSSYPAPKRKRLSFHDLSLKYFCKIKWINSIEIALQKKSLCCLDLAVGTPNRWCKKAIKLQMIRCLPPFCAEYLTPDIPFHQHSMLGLFYDEFHEFFQTRFESFQKIHETFTEKIYAAFEKQFFANIYNKKSRADLKRAVVRYLRTVCLLKIFHRGDKNRFTQVYLTLLLILYTYFPIDSDLAVAMLRTMCVNDDVKPYVLVLPDDKTLEYLLCRAQDMRFDFWGLWRRGGHLSGRFNPVAVLFGSLGRNELTRTLLNYGFQYSADGTVYEERCRSLATVRYQGMGIIDSAGMWRLVMRRPRDRMLMILDIFMTFVHFDEDFNASDKVSTLVHISRSLPHPYVTAGEIYHNISGALQLTFQQKLVKVCQRYSSEEIYDYDYRVLQPRRLSHLSRCAVRKALADNLRLPGGIEELELEDTLKDYLLLQR